MGLTFREKHNAEDEQRVITILQNRGGMSRGQLQRCLHPYGYNRIQDTLNRLIIGNVVEVDGTQFRLKSKRLRISSVKEQIARLQEELADLEKGGDNATQIND